MIPIKLNCIQSVLLAFILGHLVPGGARGQDIIQSAVRGEPLSVLRVYEIARDSDPDLAIARYRVDGAEAQKDVARGNLLPQVSIFSDWSSNRVRYEGTPMGQLPSQNYPGERYGIQLRTPLFNVSSLREYERKGALVSQSEYDLAFAETNLLSSVVQAFLTILLADERVSFSLNRSSPLFNSSWRRTALCSPSL